MTDPIPADAVEAAARADYLRQFENSGIAAQAVIPHKLRAIGAENALADLRAGIEALRDEWRSAADAAFAAYPNPIGTRDGFPRGYASAQSVHAAALDALLREGE